MAEKIQGVQLNVDVAKLSKACKLMISTPMYGGQCAGLFTRSFVELTKLLNQLHIEYEVDYLFNESLITRARNYCCDTFMRSDCTNLLFLDSDIGFNPHDIIAIMAMQNEDTPFDIMGAPYPKKTISWEKIQMAVERGEADKDPENLSNYVGDFVFNPIADNFSLDKMGQPVQVLEIGTGFMMIRRKTLEKFKATYPQYMYKPDHVRSEHFDGSRPIMQFFQAEIDQPDAEQFFMPLMKAISSGEVENPQEEMTKALENYKEAHSKSSRRYLSEDYWFCQKAIRAGMHIWLCPWMKTQHVGSYVFGGSVVDLMKLGANATADLKTMNELKKKRGQPTIKEALGGSLDNKIPAPKRGPKAKTKAK